MQQQHQQQQQQQQHQQQQQIPLRSRRLRIKMRFLRRYKRFIKHAMENYDYPVEDLNDTLERICDKCGKKKPIEEVVQVCEGNHFNCIDCYMEEVSKYYVNEPIFYIPCPRCQGPSLVFAFAVNQ